MKNYQIKKEINWPKFSQKSGFTLIEMLVAVMVFMIVFLIASSFVNLASGSTKSNHTKMLTGDVRSALDTIMQKLNSANDKVAIGGDMVYGFALHTLGSQKILGIVHQIDMSHKECTFIGKRSTGIYMKVDNDDNNCSWPTNPSQLNQPLTDSSKIDVTSLTFNPPSNPGYVMTNQNPTQSPYLFIHIDAWDKDSKYQTDNQITIDTSFTMDYATIDRLKKL